MPITVDRASRQRAARRAAQGRAAPRASRPANASVVRGLGIEREQQRAERTDRACTCDGARCACGDAARDAQRDDTIRALVASRACRAHSLVVARLPCLRCSRRRRRQRRAKPQAEAGSRMPRTSYAARADVRAFAAEVAARQRLRHARRRALARRGELPAEDRRARWTGRCSSRRSGSSTRRRSCRRSASTAASRSGATTRPRSRARESDVRRARRRSSSRSSASRRSTAATPGSYRVIDALATLAFDYPRRAPFFRGELQASSCCSRASRASRRSTPKGSFAGAMGMPQFMPGSYRRFAVDFDGDGHIDLWREQRRRDRQRRELPRAPRLAARPAGAAARGASTPEARDARAAAARRRHQRTASAGGVAARRRRPARAAAVGLPRRSRRPAAARGSAGERRGRASLLDRVSQLLRDHALQQEPALRGGGVGARASDQAMRTPQRADDHAPTIAVPQADERDARRDAKDAAAAGRHAPARPPAGRRAARADRRGRLRAHRGDPPDGDPLPARRRAPRPPPSAPSSTALLNDLPIARRSMSCARSATSRISPTSPRTCTRTAGGARTRSRGSPPQRGSIADALERVARDGVDGARDRRAGSPTRW